MTPEEREKKIEKILGKMYKVEGVEYDINKRWEQGTDHHPKKEK